MVRDGASVTNGNHRKFAEDTLNGNDVQDRFLVVKLINHPRADRFQSSFTEENAIMRISAIIYISVIMAKTIIICIICIIAIITIIRIIVGFQG